jgi:hypothetical protein
VQPFERGASQQRAGAGPNPLAMRQEWFGEEQRGTFTWGERELSFRFLAAHEGQNGAFEVGGLVLPDELLTWFQTTQKSEDGRPMLVYQRQQTDSSGWSFLRRALGDRFEEPLYSGELEDWLGVGTTLLRPSGWKNLAHVRRVVGLLGGLPGATCSWCAFCTEAGDEPLRFVSAEAEPWPLDTAWRLVPGAGNGVPHELADLPGHSYEVRRRFTTLDLAKASGLITELAVSGRRANLESLGCEDVVSQLPHMPMPVSLRDTAYLCERAVFRFSSPHSVLASEVAPVLDVQLFLRGLPTRAWGNTLQHRARGTFASWDEPSGKTRLRLASEEQSWALMGDGGEDDAGQATDREAPAPGLGLVTESVTPYAARGEFSGFYVKHQVKDSLVVELSDLSVPRTLGGLQVYAEQFETPELTLNSRTIVVTTVGNTSELNVTGVKYDGDAGTVEVYAEEKVRIKERITVVEESSTFEHNAVVTGTAEVKKDTKLGANLEVKGDLEVGGKADVGG